MVKPLFWISSTVVLSLFATKPAIAQSITAVPDGTGTVLTIDGNTYHIEGGTQAGENLFHSFEQFGLSTGEIANFLSNPSVTNILGRVTGGDPSVINGLLQVTGANSNLYLMNPAGIVFGSGASLNVGGDFVATTADRIAVGDGWFMSSGMNDYASLVGTPNQFAFASETPGAILNFGDLSNDENVSLIGGTVLNEGAIASTQGNVILAAVPGQRLVKISQPGMLLSLEVDEGAIANPIKPIDLPTLLTGAGRGNPPVVAPNPAGVSTGALPLQGDILIAGEVSGQQVDLYAAGQIKPTDTDLVEGKTRVVRFSETGEDPTQVVFIDARVDNSQALLYGAEAGTVSQIIERDEDGIAVVSEQLATLSESAGDLESVAIVAEGNEGNFWLGNQWIRAENLDNYTTQLQAWGEALTASADLLLYSCFTALGATGEALVASIADLTGADVAASVNATGSANYAGDWVLESNIGAIEAENPFTTQTITSWDGKLTTQTVTTTADAGAGSLRAAIAAAGMGDMIIFDTTGIFGTAQTITLTSSAIAIAASKDNLTIDGPGQNQLAIDGNGSNHVFNVFADNITIQDLTIQNGFSGGSGGGIRFNGSGSLSVENSTISGNTAFNGGGIFVGTSAQSLIVKNSVMSGNSATASGGAIYFENGADPITLEITNSIIANNQTAGLATVQFNSRLGSATISGSTFSGNRVGGGGGAINTNATLNVDSTTIAGNSAGGQGGGISNTFGNTTITNSIITNNTSGTEGGGIYGYNNLPGGTLTVENTVISGNTADKGDGIFARESPLVLRTSGDLNLTDSIQTDEANAKISLTGNNINLSTGIQSDGADIFINAGSSVTALTAEATISSSGDTGGDITIIAGSDLNLRNLISAGTNGDGGDITITSTGGVTNTTFGGSEGLINSSANNGNAGDVSVKTNGAMTIGKIFAESLGGAGGRVNLESSSLVRLTGTSTGLFGTPNASISTAGSTAGGTITIRHGGMGLVPFTVGNASSNGSAGSLSTGTGQTLLPTQSFLFDFTQGGINILSTTAPVPLTLPTLGSNPSPLLFDGKSPAELLVETIGEQLGGSTTIDFENNKFAWTIPGEPDAIAGNLPITTEGAIDIAAIDEQLEGEYEDYFGEEFDTEEAGVTLASIREMLTRIESQTGTRPVLIYALSYAESLELLLITAQDDEPVIRKIVPEAAKRPLSRAVQRFSRRIQNPHSDRYLQPAQQLYNWLIEPLRDELESHNVDTLIFAMSEGLRTLPLAALHDGEEFLVEQYSIGMIPSVSLTNSDYQPLHNASIVAMGVSEFRHLPPLPAVPLELAAIAQAHPSSQQFLNEAFTLENLKIQSRDRRNHSIIHLATHAAFPAGNAENAYIQLWEQSVQLSDLRNFNWYDHSQIELLLLSACETAVGDPFAELGFAGLAVQTGVKSALASFWQVSDLGTLALMNSFYSALADSNIFIKAEALRHAQIALLSGEQTLQKGQIGDLMLPPELARYRHTDLTHPYYWSGFTLVGSPW